MTENFLHRLLISQLRNCSRPRNFTKVSRNINFNEQIQATAEFFHQISRLRASRVPAVVRHGKQTVTDSYVTTWIGLTPARTRVARVYASGPRGMRAERRLRRASELAITLIRWIFRGIKGASVWRKRGTRALPVGNAGSWMECRVSDGGSSR